MRKVVIAGNWKMHKTAEEAQAFVQEVRQTLRKREPECEVIVGPPFTALDAAVSASRGTSIQVAGQNMHWEEQGAFTGEVSAPMLKDAGCACVIIGHSERRQLFGETDDRVNSKVRAALRCNLVPILCVGETLEERDSGQAFDIVKKELRAGLKDVSIASPTDIMVAYEPVWAIGTGKTATPDQAQEMHGHIRKELTTIFSEDIAMGVRILYGGSVKPDNIKELLQQTDIDGALIGGASLKSKDFTDIIQAAG
jgi:triosephosphate isomerase (TIM)